MDKYEYRVKTEQMLEYMEKKQYKKAMEIADTIDWRRVKNASMLNSVSEIYEYNGENQKSRDVLFLAYDRAPESRKIVYRLGTLALKINDTEEATDCYEEFIKLAPKDPNQYILKYKILRARRAPIAEQIHALEEFKKAEYVEKWAYELASLYHEAGMSAECLEECDDLILWFSEGQYVYKAMELKMQYKPLTPLQQEKYNNRFKDEEFMRKQEALEESVEEETNDSEETEEVSVEQQEAEEAAEAEEKPVKKNSAKEALEKVLRRSDAQTNKLDVQAIIEEALPVEKEESEDEAETEEAEETETDVEKPETEEAEAEPEEEKKVREESPIRKTVKGATLAEALKNGVALANGLDIEEKASRKRDEELRITGQMKIDEILQEWEAKQRENAEAIKTQKQKDEERLAQKRREAEKRREEEARRIEEQQRAAEEARRIAEQKAAEEARRIAIRKAEEERLLAEQRAEEERRLAAEKAEEEERLLERMAAGKITKELEEAIRRKPEAEEEPDDEDDYEVVEEVEEIEKETEEDFDDEDDYEVVEEVEEVEEETEEDFDDEDDYEVVEEVKKVEKVEKKIEDDDEDDYELVEEIEEVEKEPDDEDDYELVEEIEKVEKKDKSDDVLGMTADLLQLMKEMEQSDSGRKNEAPVDIHLDEDDFDLDDDDDFDDYDEDDYDEGDFDDEDDEDDYDEDDFEDYDDDDDEDDDDEDDDDEDDDDDYDEIEFEEEEVEEKEELVIEEPTEEEIQKRIKKGKAGVPFDTGFVVTGRYDLSATSEIGLKAGLTEEQKKLFSYFVPVRGMSEQIVEVLDNDRREKREGTSRTGNILVIGQKGSGKTVLAVDIVKAIQRQRNLRQGKVAIVTGESLNKKELTNIIKKLRGGAIIIEKAGKLNSRTVKELNYLMEKKTGELLFVLEDQRKPLEKLFIANPEFKKKFTSRLELPVFINDELVTFGQTYAKENGYKLDEMGILALYSRIDIMQREDHAVTVAEVKEIMDAAIQHSQKANVKHLARRMFGKSTDSSDRIILKEEDFRI